MPTAMTFPLRPYQQEGVSFALPRPATMVNGGLGVGKSRIACEAVKQWDSRRTLVLCPPSVRSVWRREAAKWTPETTAVILDRGSVAERTAMADQAIRQNGRVLIAVNTEAAWREPLASWILAQRWDTIIADESHMGGIKGNDTQASRFARRLTGISEHRLCLSGTPLGHSPLDAWGQYRFMGYGFNDLTYEQYLKRFAAPRQIRTRKRLKASHADLYASVSACFGADSPLLDELGEPPDMTEVLPGIRNKDEFMARIKPWTWQCRSADVLDLPPLISDTREVQLTPEQQRHYMDLERYLWTELEGKGVTVTAPLTLLVRWQQITSGFCGLDGGGIHRFAKNPKRDALRDLLAETNEPTVVFGRFVADLDTVESVCRELGLRYRELSHRRKDAVTETAELADCDVAGVQPQSGGVGIDLSRAKIGMFYSLANRLPEYDQAVGRLHRPGTTGCRLYSLIASDTVDADIHLVIADRREIVEALLKKIRNPR